MAEHWDEAYAQGEATRSWFATEPVLSLRMLDAAGVSPDASVVDVGGGTSRLVDSLLARGHHDVTVVDVSDVALGIAKRRLGCDAARVHWVHADARTWSPGRTFDVWQDRAVMHFLTSAADLQRYLHTLNTATGPGAVAVFGCFAPEGPTHCSVCPSCAGTPKIWPRYSAHSGRWSPPTGSCTPRQAAPSSPSPGRHLCGQVQQSGSRAAHSACSASGRMR